MKQLSVSQFCRLSFFLLDRNSHLVSDTDPGPLLGPASGLGSGQLPLYKQDKEICFQISLLVTKKFLEW